MARRNRQVVFFFREGDPTAPQVFGGKGAGLVQMTKARFPVPPGFVISTSVSRAFQQESTLPARLQWQLNRGISHIEKETGLKFGGTKPLLVSVRSGAPVSMPGMMDTVLNVGMNQEILVQLITQSGDAEFGYDTYHRFLLGFGTIVLGFDQATLENVSKEATSQEACHQIRALLGSALTDDPREQLKQAIAAVCKSWNSSRARDYRSLYGIPSQLGTAVVVQAMVFGNRSNESGSGVVFSRNVATGSSELYGEFVTRGQGESLVSGAQTPESLLALRNMSERLYAELSSVARELERLEKDAVDVEFTVDNGRLHILQQRVAKRTNQAAMRIAVEMVQEGLITEKEAISRFSKEELTRFAKPVSRFSQPHLELSRECGVSGLAASPGAAVGKVCFSSEVAQTLSRHGEQVILVLPETSPDDFAGMIASSAIVTSRGGTTCHAAVVARALGVPAVVGTGAEIGKDFVRIGGEEVKEGEILSVDGFAGIVLVGRLSLVEGKPSAEAETLLGWVRKHEQLVDLSLFDQRFSVNTILNDVYILETIRPESVDDSLRREIEMCYDQSLHLYAQLFATYLMASVAGELRHGWDFLSHADRARLVGWNVLHHSDRTEAQVVTVKRLLEAGGNGALIEFCHIAERTFPRFIQHNYGGRPWVVISETVRKYLNGEINQTLFVDRVFDLRHNTGLPFDKHPVVSYQIDLDNLNRQLDVKRNTLNPKERVKKLLSFGSVSTAVLNLLDRTIP